MSRRFTHLFTVAAALAVLAPLDGAAEDSPMLQPLDGIRNTAQRVAEQSVALDSASGGSTTVSVGQVDPRLRLPACSEPLDGFLPSNSAARTNMTVGVRCNGTSPWTVYVPVSVSIVRPVVVLSRPLARDAILGVSDLDIDLREISPSAAYFDDPNAVLGKVLVRPGIAGQVLTPNQLGSGVAVKRGQQVTLVANSGGILVRMRGTAMADAGIGDRLKVKNSASTRIVEGTVLADGSVEVGL